jgi:hypothetical protein
VNPTPADIKTAARQLPPIRELRAPPTNGLPSCVTYNVMESIALSPDSKADPRIFTFALNRRRNVRTGRGVHWWEFVCARPM